MPLTIRDRLWHALFGLALLPLCWIAMMAIHEASHIAVALYYGAGIEHVHFPLFGFSYTTYDYRPKPLVIAAAGPVLGCVLPLLLLPPLEIRYRRRVQPLYHVKTEPSEASPPLPAITFATLLARFFAGFCLIANGAYLGVGWLDEIGDAGDIVMFSRGVEAAGAAMLGFGVVTVSLGLALWHTVGPLFGLGPNPPRPRAWIAWLTLGLTLVAVAIDLAVTRT